MIPEHFFIVGAQRSGTSYLYTLLDAHPQILMAQPRRPEPKFFLIDTLYEKGLDHYYTQFFAPDARTSGRVLGEKSTSYIESEKAAQRIMMHFPQAKIIATLREPVARAISNYHFSANNGLETLPILEAFQQEAQRRDAYDHDRISASPYAYLQRGHYINYIEMYTRHVPTDQMKILIYEQLVSDPTVLADLFTFLGVSPDFKPPTRSERVNSSVGDTGSIPEDVYTFARAAFRESNQRLADYLGVDLGRWWLL